MRLFNYIALFILIFNLFFLNAQVNIRSTSVFKIQKGTIVVGLDHLLEVRDSESDLTEKEDYITAIGEVFIAGEFPKTQEHLVEKQTLVKNNTEIYESNEEKIDSGQLSNKSNTDDSKENDKKLIKQSPLHKDTFINDFSHKSALVHIKPSISKDIYLKQENDLYFHNSSINSIDGKIVFVNKYIAFHYPIRSPPKRFI